MMYHVFLPRSDLEPGRDHHGCDNPQHARPVRHGGLDGCGRDSRTLRHGHAIVEFKVSYDRKDGQEVAIPCVTIFHTNAAGKIDNYRVYFDVAPIYA
jgi:hypothetical protein